MNVQTLDGALAGEVEQQFTKRDKERKRAWQNEIMAQEWVRRRNNAL